ncbi:MAG TPA: class I SAM-dependent methyltransferase [Methylomirabilota bacterium]|nr:class I SAM-dependent methyltransferase [Methylomirabilota bacterium]
MNRYDDFRPDVPRLLQEQDKRLPAAPPGARSGEGLGPLDRVASRLRLYALGLLVLTGWHRTLVYANLKLGWFAEFRRYWVDELGNRPIHPHDFYHLTGVYRQRLQSIAPDLSNDAAQLESWRDPRIVYHLFAHTYRQALSPLRVQRFARFLPRRGRVAEFGCGAAPIVSALARHYRHLDLELVAADIPHLLFHFVRWRFRATPYVTVTPILPGDDAPLPGRYDAIFCLEVLEHVPRPLAVLRHFLDVLKPGGVLVFDFIRSEAEGLDSAAALRDRDPALRFVREHFDVVRGQVPLDGSHVQPTVVRKRGRPEDAAAR